MATRYKICSRQEYEQNGQKKTAWPVVGYFIDSGDKKYVTLNLMPNQLFHVYPVDQQQKAAGSDHQEEVQY